MIHKSICAEGTIHFPCCAETGKSAWTCRIASDNATASPWQSPYDEEKEGYLPRHPPPHSGACALRRIVPWRGVTWRDEVLQVTVWFTAMFMHGSIRLHSV